MEKVEWREFTSIAWDCPNCETGNEIRAEDFGYGATFEEKCDSCGETYKIIPR